jgi:hypothetical protein
MIPASKQGVFAHVSSSVIGILSIDERHNESTAGNPINVVLEGLLFRHVVLFEKLRMTILDHVDPGPAAWQAEPN